MANAQSGITPAIAAPHDSRWRLAENKGPSVPLLLSILTSAFLSGRRQAFLSEQKRTGWPSLPERTRPDPRRHRAARQRVPVFSLASTTCGRRVAAVLRRRKVTGGGRVGDEAQDPAAGEGRAVHGGAGHMAEAAARTHRRFTPAMRLARLTIVHRITRLITQ
ncbi:hypothetical protein FIBSPDRAFT_933774 [Athelia psychrophila]|uniref:Uncharacterized protein n=1 Tax=Athelia psychrophila TaxID=1759441 RepID=A0A166GHI5_9AGAM|nr:hypothetical protein FIBSPDRAFT_933774 [Fibularhizoctonia sp. CBS 109695]